MSQAGLINIAGGGGGGTPVQTLTPNSGGAVSPVSNNINVFGLAANSGGNAFPIFSYNGGAGQFNIADNTFLTPYVVDPSTTPGSEGTFTSIQAAVNQAVSDGATSSSPRTIICRYSLDFETVTIPASVVINIIGLAPALFTGGGANIYNTCTLANLIVGSGAHVTLSNFTVYAISGDAVTNVSGTFLANSCSLQALSGNAYNTTSSATNSSLGDFFNCGLATMTVGGSATANITSCTGGSPNVLFINQTATVNAYESDFYNITLANSSVLNMYSCILNSITGSSSAAQSLYNNIFNGGTASPVNPTATINSFGNLTTTGDQVFGSNVTNAVQPGQIGSLQNINIQTGSYGTTYSDQFIGATTSSAAPTITLVANPGKGMTQTIADISGNASVNNITVSGNGNNILGPSSASTFVMNTNGASATFVWTGTVWKVI
jgi:hypothetical protein